jgi:uncharacterized protein YjbI with pentapeptide repeats
VAAETDPPQATDPEARSEGHASSISKKSGILAAVALAVMIILIVYGYLDRPGSGLIGVANKRLWDYLELLIVPAALALGVYRLNRTQNERDQQAEEKRRRRESAAQAKQAKQALDLENERQQEAAVQAYLDQLTQLLVTQRDQGLIRMRVDDEVRQVIQARSEPLLRSLTATRRWNLILFLSVMGLLTKDRPLVSLAGADLTGIDGHGAPLEGIDLHGANLSEADLSEAHLEGAYLYDADLRGASLLGAHLEGAYLFGANLTGADLHGAHLEGAYLNSVDLRDKDLQNAYLTATFLSGAKLPDESMLDPADLDKANGDWTTDVGEFLRPRWWGNLPGHETALVPADYSIKLWQTLLYFSVLGEGWYSQLRLPYGIVLSRVGLTNAGGHIIFFSGPFVADPHKPKDPLALVPAPKDTGDWFTWFMHHPHLSVTMAQEWENPSGGASGMQFYVEVNAEAPENGLYNLPAGPSVPVFPMVPRFTTYVLTKGKRSRVIVLEDEGEWMVILTESLPNEFDAFKHRVDEEVLANLYWGRKAHKHLGGE